jgi:DNA replication protein DnaC
VLYQRIPRLFSDLALARGDGRYARLMRAVGGVKLLILDDWGLEPLTAEQRHDLLEIVEDRYGAWRNVGHQSNPSGPLARPDRRLDAFMMPLPWTG